MYQKKSKENYILNKSWKFLYKIHISLQDITIWKYKGYIVKYYVFSK